MEVIMTAGSTGVGASMTGKANRVSIAARKSAASSRPDAQHFIARAAREDKNGEGVKVESDLINRFLLYPFPFTRFPSSLKVFQDEVGHHLSHVFDERRFGHAVARLWIEH